MEISIRNDRCETILLLHSDENEKLTIQTVPSRRKAYVSEKYKDSDGEMCYQVTVNIAEELVEQISNDALLNELRRRMVIV
nr:hypothetical protein [uncultured Lachnoclostridium sp.]